MDILFPGRISHIGPLVPVESGRAVEAIFRDLQHEALVLSIEFQCVPGHGEKFLTQAEKPAKRVSRSS